MLKIVAPITNVDFYLHQYNRFVVVDVGIIQTIHVMLMLGGGSPFTSNGLDLSFNLFLHGELLAILEFEIDGMDLYTTFAFFIS